MKKKIISAFGLILSICIVFCSCSKAPENIDDKIEGIVSTALIEHKNIHSDFGECYAEGHIILGYNDYNSGYDIYVLTKSIIYGFENGNFVNVMNSQTGGAVINVNKKLEVKSVTYTSQGKSLESSVKKLFPEQYHERLLNVSFGDDKIIEDQQVAYAQQYLESIGRDAQIGKKDDFKNLYTTMSDLVISPSVIKTLDSNPLLKKYPYWDGSREAIENGERVVYSSNFDLTNERITYEKTNYDSGETIELYYFSSNTGEELK